VLLRRARDSFNQNENGDIKFFMYYGSTEIVVVVSRRALEQLSPQSQDLTGVANSFENNGNLLKNRLVKSSRLLDLIQSLSQSLT
jgi:hypothetical protein